MRRCWPLLVVLALVGCPAGDDDDTAGDDDTVGDDDTADDPLWEGCRATPQVADRDRLVVAALPYDPSGGQAPAWAAMTLGADGSLVDDGVRFEMGRAMDGTVAFTPDGQVGLIAQEDGTVGVFRAAGDGDVEVIHAAYSGDFYATAVVVEPSGERAWIVDGNWAENGGGLYEVAIDCDDGSLSGGELVLPSKLAADLLFHPTRTDRVVLVAEEVAGTEAGDEAVLLAYDELEALDGVDAFGDDEAWTPDAAITADGRYTLLADNSAFSGPGNRVAVAAVGEDTLEPAQVLTAMEDPVALVTSPFDDAALVVSGYGDAIFQLAYDPDAAEPFTDLGDLDYHGARPALPAAAAGVDRGSLAGLTLVTENQGVRLVQFEGDGTVTDLGVAVDGDGFEWIMGAVGVAP